jgi:Universal stress protein family
MSVVLAAIDNSAAATPVLAAASAIARPLGSAVEAVHVREDGTLTAAAVAREAGISLRELAAPVREGLLAETARSDVKLLVVGMRSLPVARRAAGHVARELMISIRKPLVVVPPQARIPFQLRRALVPVEATRTPAAALSQVSELVCGSGVEVIVLHVHDAESLPLFSNHPQHETPAWSSEFLARYCRALEGDAQLELRVGAPGQSVADVAQETDADLVALTWSQDLSAGRAAVVQEVLTRAAVPVLLVPVGVSAGA